MNQSERITKARLGIVLDAPFFASLILRLQMIPDHTVPTFCTDGRVIRYNEGFCAKLTDLQVKGVLVHEVAHLALGHPWREGDREHLRWNVACDFAINEMIESYAAECRDKRAAVPFELPPGVCLDIPFSKGKSSEEIYNLLPAPPPSGGGASAAVSAGEFERPGSPAEARESENEWRVATIQAAQAAKMQGNCPACIRRLVDEILEPKVPWRELLRQFIRQRAREDYAWTRPARRYLHQGVILPGMYSETMGRIVVAVDTSGSITDHLLAEFQAEIQSALDECRPESVEVVYCDAMVHGTAEFQPGDPVRLEMKGGGGTDFRPVFDHIEKADDAPEMLIYLTDMMGTSPSAGPEYPVMWAAYGGYEGKAPFGELVAVK